MKKLKILADIQDSYNELVHKVSWPTKSELEDLKYIIAKIGILDFCIKNFFDLVLFSAYGTQNVPAFFFFRH